MKNKILIIFILIVLIVAPLNVIGVHNINKNKRDKDFENNTNQKYITNEIIIKIKNPETKSLSIDNLNKKNKVTSIKKIFKNAENTILDNIYLLTIQENIDILEIIKKYSSHPDVIYAEPNGIPYLCSIPDDNDFDKQWGLHNTGQNGGISDSDIDAPEAWDIETGDSSIVIAMIDSGIDYNHPDLKDNLWINQDEIPDNNIDDDQNGYIDDVISWNFINNNADPKDEHAHGTHCSGIASAVTNNDQGVAGVCWNCKIMPVKIANEYWDTTVEIVANGIKYAADNGANVISMSFGWSTPYNILRDAIDYAYEKRIIMVAAAGNHGSSNRLYPAAFSNVIAVGGINRNNSRLYYYYESVDYWVISNYGSWVDVAAPAQEIYSTMPTYHVFYNNIQNNLGLNMNYDYMSGTSMACPNVAGIVALILSKNPTLTPDQVKKIIKGNVEPYDSEYYIGTGFVNAYKALLACNNPNKPSINGRSTGKAGESYEYTFIGTDPDGHNISYIIDWGDNTSIDILGPYPSGEQIKATHTWEEQGNYQIKAKTKDIYDLESNWEIFDISMPKNRIINFKIILYQFINNHPILQSMLKSFI